MKPLKTIPFFIIIAVFFISCSDNGSDSRENPKTLKISPKLLDFGNVLSTMSFTITNNTDEMASYTITDDRDWITCNPTNGTIDTETDAVSVTIERIGDPGNRSGTIKVATDVDTLEIEVRMIIAGYAGDYYSGTLEINITQSWPDDNIFSEYSDDIAIDFTLIVSDQYVAGTGTATRSCSVVEGTCTLIGITAPSFVVAITGTVSEGYLDFYAIPTNAMSTDVTINMMCDDDPVTIPHMGLLESYVLTQNVLVHVAGQDGATGSGSGTSDIGEDPEFDYTYGVEIHEL